MAEQQVFYGSFSRTGISCIGVGGGAYSNATEGRMVLHNGQAPHALFIRSHGDLACSNEQAIVPVRIGDVILRITGKLPASPENPDLRIQVYRVIALIQEDDERLRIVVEEDAGALPALWEDEVPWDALGTYHNRDGKPFVA